MNKAYENEILRVEVMLQIASDRREQDYWRGYRRGMADNEPNVDRIARSTREVEHDLSVSSSPARQDDTLAIVALGYWDGRRWETRKTRDFRQRLSIGEWIEAYGEIYGLRSPEGLRQKFRGQRDFRTGNAKSPPKPWATMKIGRQWLAVIE